MDGDIGDTLAHSFGLEATRVLLLVFIWGVDMGFTSYHKLSIGGMEYEVADCFVWVFIWGTIWHFCDTQHQAYPAYLDHRFRIYIVAFMEIQRGLTSCSWMVIVELNGGRRERLVTSRLFEEPGCKGSKSIDSLSQGN